MFVAFVFLINDLSAAAASAQAGPETANCPIFTMGFEIETSVFKFTEHDTKIDSKNKKWELAADTSDQSTDQALYNVEARTRSGLGRVDIISAAKEVGAVFSFFDREWERYPDKAKQLRKVQLSGVVAQEVAAAGKLLTDTIPKSIKERFVSMRPNGDVPQSEELMPEEGGCLGLYTAFQKKLPDFSVVCEEIETQRQNYMDEAKLSITTEMQGNFLTVSKPFSIVKLSAASHHIKKLVYPQITYGLPLSSIGVLIQHLSEILTKEGSHTPFFKFLSCFCGRDLRNAPDPLSCLEISVTAVRALSDIVRKNRTRAQEQQLRAVPASEQQPFPIETEKLKNIVSALQELEKKNKPAAGLAWLFVLYAHALFWEARPDMQEIGPKPSLGIMSRIPFSAMYDNLSKSNQEVFNNFIITIKTKYPELFSRKIIKYKDYTGMDVGEEKRISLDDWFNSVVDSAKRENKNKDLLSPPKGCDDESSRYGMGAYTPVASNEESAEDRYKIPLPGGYALIEVRGYSKAKYNKEEVTLDNFHGLVESEAGWFFSLVSDGGEQ